MVHSNRRSLLAVLGKSRLLGAGTQKKKHMAQDCKLNLQADVSLAANTPATNVRATQRIPCDPPLVFPSCQLMPGELHNTASAVLPNHALSVRGDQRRPASMAAWKPPAYRLFESSPWRCFCGFRAKGQTLPGQNLSDARLPSISLRAQRSRDLTRSK